MDSGSGSPIPVATAPTPVQDSETELATVALTPAHHDPPTHDTAVLLGADSSGSLPASALSPRSHELKQAGDRGCLSLVRTVAKSTAARVIGVILLTIIAIAVIVSLTPGSRSPDALTLCQVYDPSPYLSLPGDPRLGLVQSVVPDTKIAFVGDTGLTDQGRRLFQLIAGERVHGIVHQGDLDYTFSPQHWMQQIDQFVGTNVPVFAAAGNHDGCIWPQYQQQIVARLQRLGVSACSGIVGLRQTCAFRGLLILNVGPGASAGYSIPKFDQLEVSNPSDSYLEQQLSALGNQSIWRVCSWHKTQHLMQTGSMYPDETGWGVYETCRQHGAMIMTGHEHAYGRTFTMSALETPTVASVNGSVVTLAPGETFVVFNGLGGASVRSRADNNTWWAAVANKGTGAQATALLCTFAPGGDQRRAECVAKDVGGNTVDRFTVLNDNSFA